MTTTVPVGAWAQLTLVEAKMVWRDTAGLLIPIGLPILIIVMNGIGVSPSMPRFDGLSAVDAVATPIGLTMILAILGVVNVPSFLAAYRRYGVLRRLAVTPAHPAMVLVAQVVVNLALGIIGIIAALTVARLAFGLTPPRQLGWALAGLALGACALYAVGLLVGAVAPTPNAAVAIGLTLFFATMAAGGGFVPSEALPGWLATIGEYTPFGAALQAIRDSWVGSTPQPLHLVVLAVTTLVAGGAAIKIFRWE